MYYRNEVCYLVKVFNSEKLEMILIYVTRAAMKNENTKLRIKMIQAEKYPERN